MTNTKIYNNDNWNTTMGSLGKYMHAIHACMVESMDAFVHLFIDLSESMLFLRVCPHVCVNVCTQR